MRPLIALALLSLSFSLLPGCLIKDPAEDGSTTDDSTTDDSTTDDSTTDDSTTTGPDTDTDPPLPGTETGTETDGSIPGCECILDEDHDDYAVPAAPLCGEPLCANVSGHCDQFCGELEQPPLVLDDPEALACALTALRDRSPGVVTWYLAELGGQYDNSGYLLIKDDGMVVRRDWGWSDQDYNGSDAVLGELPSPEHFDACLAEPNDQMRFDCLRGGVESMIAVCDEGWTVFPNVGIPSGRDL